MTHLPSPGTWPACGSPVGEDDLAPGRMWSWPTRRTPPARSANTCASAASGPWSPPPADQRGHRLRRGSRGGRPPAFDRKTYKQRNTVERCNNRLKQWRGIATRYEKTATIHLAGLHSAGIFLWSAR